MSPDSADLPEVSSNNFGIDSALKPAGRLKFFLPEWRELTSDSQILKTVKGFNVEFVDRPPTQVYFIQRKFHLIQKKHTFLI